ncbi:hypothetical protein LSAT2_031768 [Lamellibrachia satsuma]|nr:hypothetical protein LSAT2_031768 [Lamellibrachia satsuma]
MRASVFLLFAFLALAFVAAYAAVEKEADDPSVAVNEDSDEASGATVMATESVSDATPRNGCIRQVARVFRASSVRGCHNKSRRLQGDAVNVITRLYEIVQLLVWV